MTRVEEAEVEAEAVIGTDGMLDLLTERSKKLFKHDTFGLAIGKWNHCDGGTLMMFPSPESLKGPAGAWLCAVVLPASGGGYVTGLWSPMFARGGQSESGFTPYDNEEVFDTVEEAKRVALAGLAKAIGHHQRGKYRFGWLIVGVTVAAAVAWAALAT